MTTSTNDPAAIDAVIGALSDSGADLTSPIKQGHAGYIYDSASDSFTQTTAAPATGITAQPLFDDGRDLQAAHASIIANVDALQAKLDSTSFSSTGEQKFTVTGRDREVLQAQLRQARISGAYDIERLNEIHAQRGRVGQQNTAPVQMADGKTTTLQEAAARMAYIDSAPPGQRAAFASEYDRMMQEGRTRSVTDAISAATRRR